MVPRFKVTHLWIRSNPRPQFLCALDSVACSTSPVRSDAYNGIPASLSSSLSVLPRPFTLGFLCALALLPRRSTRLNPLTIAKESAYLQACFSPHTSLHSSNYGGLTEGGCCLLIIGILFNAVSIQWNPMGNILLISDKATFCLAFPVPDDAENH